MIKGLEEYSGGQVKLPENLELLDSPEVNKYLIEACEKFDVKCPPPQTTTRLLDKVCGRVIFYLSFSLFLTHYQVQLIPAFAAVHILVRVL